MCPPAVVLEANERAAIPLDHHVADEARRLRAGMYGVNVKDTGARKFVAFEAAIVVPGQLVSAAYCQEWEAGLDAVSQRGTFHSSKVFGYSSLLDILRPAHESEVIILRIKSVTRPKLIHFEVDATGLATVAKGHDVAAVAVDIH
jgi:hypothetical protein